MTNTITRQGERPVRTTSRSTATRRQVLLVASVTTLAVCGTAVAMSAATSADPSIGPATVAPHTPDRAGGLDVQERAGIARQAERWGGLDVQERAGIARQAERWGGLDVQERAGIAAQETQR